MPVADGDTRLQHPDSRLPALTWARGEVCCYPGEAVRGAEGLEERAKEAEGTVLPTVPLPGTWQGCGLRACTSCSTVTCEFQGPLRSCPTPSPRDEQPFQALGGPGAWTTDSQEGGGDQSSQLLVSTAVRAHRRLLWGGLPEII